MPNLDKTGPLGKGPGSGRSFGSCFGFIPFEFSCQGRGLGRRRCWNWSPDQTSRKEFLPDYLKALQKEVEDVKKELADSGKTD